MKACFGECFSEESQCSGCPHKIHCKAFAGYLERTKTSTGDYFDVEYDGERFYITYTKGYSEEQLLGFCNEQIKFQNEQRRRRKIGESSSKRDSIGDAGRQKAGKSTSAYWKERRDKMIEEYKHFKAHFLKHLDTTCAPKGVAPRRGQMADVYKVMAATQEKLVRIYYKNVNYTEVMLCTLYLKTRTMTIHVQINTPVDEVGEFLTLRDKNMLKPLADTIDSKPETYTSCLGLDRERLAIAAELLAKLVKAGKFDNKMQA